MPDKRKCFYIKSCKGMVKYTICNGSLIRIWCWWFSYILYHLLLSHQVVLLRWTAIARDNKEATKTIWRLAGAGGTNLIIIVIVT